MGLLARAVERKTYDSLDLFRELYGARASKAGPKVSRERAFEVSVAFACLNVLARGGAQVPFKLFREMEQRGLKKIQPAKDHYLYDLVVFKPNDWSTSFEFRETLILHAALGNAYVFLNRSVTGKILELILLDPSKVCKEQDEDYGIVYKVTGKSGRVQKFPAEAIWNVRGPSWNGFAGMEILALAREALGLALATEETHSRLHAKGVRASGTYSVDGTLNKAQYADLKKWLEVEFAGAENSGAPMILDRAAKWSSQAMTGLDAQHLETRKFQIEEICRFFGVHPQKVFHTDKTSTYASAEEFNNQHVVDTMAAWYARVEGSADAYLLTQKEREEGLYFKFIASGLLRGSTAARAEYYTKALGSGGHPGWMTPDEVRALEELNPMGGEAGKLPPGANNGPEPEPVTP